MESSSNDDIMFLGIKSLGGGKDFFNSYLLHIINIHILKIGYQTCDELDMRDPPACHLAQSGNAIRFLSLSLSLHRSINHT